MKAINQNFSKTVFSLNFRLIKTINNEKYEKSYSNNNMNFVLLYVFHSITPSLNVRNKWFENN